MLVDLGDNNIITIVHEWTLINMYTHTHAIHKLIYIYIAY